MQHGRCGVPSSGASSAAALAVKTAAAALLAVRIPGDVATSSDQAARRGEAAPLGRGAPACAPGRTPELPPHRAALALRRVAACDSPELPGARAVAIGALPPQWARYAAKRRAGHKRSRLSVCSH
ncbi:hypothetical protein Rsub_08514 [Raphidocelis subcapitata]|uniref:Uncharacterized protein n=1 Tax=Raphidocelis subcapitata TaxID=307507 RepID=A0A2V0PCA6_9CHLO|nr:hypothetical protein Rsub_08514 [Raphidocelis subcapitata]|eukprot:GBF95533.1 hypothetical protein Rsub_08514 [Raphidocelis subcapitata]